MAEAPLIAAVPTPPAPRRAPRAAEVADDRERLSGDSRVLLVVEDDPAFARILYDLAHELGFDCLIAGTADEGALMARQYLPNAVILDIGLPDHTGLSVLDRIKRDPRTRHIPVHVVSADDNSQVALAGGAIGYMLKPVLRDQLVGVLEGLEAHMTRRLRRVLVVEDSDFFRQLLAPTLSAAGYQVSAAASAAEALRMRDAGAMFDAIVSDIEMPEMDGLQFAQAVRSSGPWIDLPMIALTAHAEPRDVEAGRDAGFTDYVVKFQRDALLSSLVQCLSESVSA